MKASLDTNVIIHLYSSGEQQILFDRFDEGIVIHQFIYDVELEHHATPDVMTPFNEDIRNGKIHIITGQWLADQGVLDLFNDYVYDQRILYNSGDLGEVYAISLAKILGAYALITDDIKQYGPHYTLMRLPESEVMPFSYVEILFLNFLEDIMDAESTITCFNQINSHTHMDWNLESSLKQFIKRFWTSPYQLREHDWMQEFCQTRNIHVKQQLILLREKLKNHR